MQTPKSNQKIKTDRRKSTSENKRDFIIIIRCLLHTTQIYVAGTLVAISHLQLS